MTEFTPLAEAASAAILLLFLGLPTAFRTKGFRTTLRHQHKAMTWFLGLAGKRVAGRLLGVLAAMARVWLALAYMLAELWIPALARQIDPWRKSLFVYCRAEFHRPQHAA